MAVRIWMDCLDSEGVGDKVLQNITNYLLNGTASYARKLDLTSENLKSCTHMKVLGIVTHQTTVLKDYISLLALTMLINLPISAYLFSCPQTTGLRAEILRGVLQLPVWFNPVQPSLQWCQETNQH